MSVFTSKPRTDGFGAQFQNIIFDILYAHNNAHNNARHKYVFPKINSFAHNYDNDPTFNQTLIDYMNLKPYFLIPKNVKYAMIPYYNTSVTYRFCETNLTTLLNSNTFKHIQNIFFENKTTPFNTAFYNVSVHVRRYNQHDDRVAGVDTPDNYYLNIIRFIRRRYNQPKPLKFHIYSQGATSDFSMYAADDTEFHINDTDVLNTFSGLVFADSLITSGSSLSYTAAILNKGVIFYKRFWHKPANHWIIGDNIQT